MGWFSRDNRDPDPEPGSSQVGASGRAAAGVPEQLPDRPTGQALTDAERTRIGVALAALEAAGVDVDDPASLGTAYDTSRAEWEGGSSTEDSGAVVERFAMGIGEHLHRHTDLSWSVVTDGFGTDLGLIGRRDDTVVVPHNLVGARWLNGDRGWIPGVVAHLVRTRADR